MDLPAGSLPTYAEPTGRWRRTALVTAVIAAVELVALLVVALAFIAKPFADDARPAEADAVPASAAAGDSAAAADAKADPKAGADAKPTAELPRTKTPVLVLNGNGVTGAASAAAQVAKSLRYPVAGIADASRRDFPRTIVMYRPGLEVEGARLARDMGLSRDQAVPLDGMRLRDLGGAKLVLIVGA